MKVTPVKVKTGRLQVAPRPISTAPVVQAHASRSVADTPYETKASLLPTSLREAVFALKDDPFFRAAMGEKFVDYYVFIKNAEIERFQSDRVGTARIF